MASYNPVTTKFSYTVADKRLLINARRLLTAVTEYGSDTEAKQSAATASNAISAVLNHIAAQNQNAK